VLAWAQGRDGTYLPLAAKDVGLAGAQPTPPPSVTAAPPAATPTRGSVTGPDALSGALAVVGLSREDLGYRPRGDWTRYPAVARTPYLLPLFEPLLDDPTRLYAVARTMGNAADRWLHPNAVNAPEIQRATYYLGFDRKVGNFREYSVNLHATPAITDALREAIRDVYQYAREDTAHHSFGGASSWDNVEEVMTRELAALPAALQLEVARGVLNQLDAIRWRDLGLRNVPPELARRVFAIRDLGDSQGDGTLYYPEIDDLMGELDEPSLYYGGQKAVEAAQLLRLAVARLPAADRCPARLVELPTPFGRVVIGTCGADTFTGDDVLLSVDPGGDDLHLDNAGGTAWIELPVALAVDVAGDDRYDCQALARGGCQGAGILGAGVLMDTAGDDTYRARTHAQGAGFIGQGALLDAAGRDQFEAGWVAQGAAFFGHGVLLEAAGDDAYRLWWDGQGYGGVGGGVGVLADRAGNDTYLAEPDVRNMPPEYRYRHYGGNGQPNTNVSFVQGAAAGRRGDGSDGHAWPGGLGALVDVAGDDGYQAGAFAQAYGYWYGVGLMYDGAGNDRYRSVYYSLASGAHYSASAIIDEGGDDAYLQEQTIPASTAGAGIAFAWDFVTALLFDRAGNDTYESNGNCLGRSAMKGNALLLDGGGNDSYTSGTGPTGLGSSDWQGYYGADPYRIYVTGYESRIISLLLDLGGRDSYLAKDFASGQTAPHPRAADGATWLGPNPDDLSPLGGEMTYRLAGVFGLGIDREGGNLPEFNRIPPPPTPPPPGLLQLDGAGVPDRGPLVPVAPTAPAER
jgi:hypothetical protein